MFWGVGPAAGPGFEGVLCWSPPVQHGGEDYANDAADGA